MDNKKLNEELIKIYNMISKLNIEANAENIQILYNVFYNIKAMLKELNCEQDV